ncbi:MAG: 30S ribosomal protein S20 [Deltaproteobacteria bacterium]|nr:MAG: 30S ribosomal protein S20 [Deltaproteobacteria bacterium]
MANHKSALKRVKQSELKHIRNKAVKTRVKNTVKEVRTGSAEAGKDNSSILNTAKSIIDKAVKKGVMHKRTASRKISRLSKLINSKSA